MEDSQYAGSDEISDVTCYKEDGTRCVMPVRTAGKPNELGVYDMTGMLMNFPL
ncbi:MAG: hypothetical protein II551_01150 [Paludibacteraceae bacterium]|nr:hypothetical protein [Paludibacteraceae bacterium]